MLNYSGNSLATPVASHSGGVHSGEQDRKAPHTSFAQWLQTLQRASIVNKCLGSWSGSHYQRLGYMHRYMLSCRLQL